MDEKLATWGAVQSAAEDHRLGLLLAGGGFLLISLDSLGIRLVTTDAWNTAFWLGAFTLLSMLIVVPLRTGSSLPRVAWEAGLPMAFSGVLQAGSTIFFVLALSTTTVANTVTIIAAAPVMAALISLVAIGERTRRRTWIAIAGAFGGILVVVSGSFGQGRVAGDLFAVAAIIAFGSNLTLLRRFPDLNRLAIVGIGGLVLAIVAFVPASPLDADPASIAILAVLGGVTGAAGRTAIISSTRYMPPAQVSLFAPMETVAATTWAWAFLGEAPPAATVAGGLIVVAAVVYGTTGATGDQDLATAP